MKGCESACHCDATARKFDRAEAEADLARLNRQGPDLPTQLMIDAIRRHPLPANPSLLDIGGGVGILHHVLLDEGFASAVQVDISEAYLTVAAAEARRRGHEGRLTLTRGDYRTAASSTAAADVVTLDRVVCCDPDYAGLLEVAAAHARHLLSLSYPRDCWYNRLVVGARNAWRRARRDAFRTFVHSPTAMAGVLEGQGLRRCWSGGTRLWSVDLYQRAA